jgi:hypothetical protein
MWHRRLRRCVQDCVLNRHYNQPTRQALEAANQQPGAIHASTDEVTNILLPQIDQFLEELKRQVRAKQAKCSAPLKTRRPGPCLK